jgi:choline dehydrogenase-like flavoprotein
MVAASQATIALDPRRWLVLECWMTRSDGLYQVAVIGVGPMGSFAAERLARAGIRVLLGLGRVEEAIPHFDTALRTRPDHPQAQRNLRADLAQPRKSHAE